MPMLPKEAEKLNCYCVPAPPPPPPPPPRRRRAPPPRRRRAPPRRRRAPPPPQQWPVFADQNSLKTSKWGAYYTAVYGELPTSQYFPLRVDSNWMLYNDILVKEAITLPRALTYCPTNQDDPYLEGNFYQPPKVVWLWHKYPYAVLPANTWQEVTHEQDPFGDEKNGAWFMYAPGSGIWFNMGQTKMFAEHQDAYSYFNIGHPADPNSAMSIAAAGQGFDSLQFTAHVDHVNYQCDSHNTGKGGFDYMGFEIVGVKLVGTYACGSKAGAPGSLRTGWMASKQCSCDNSKQFLNCQGVPLSQELDLPMTVSV